MTFKYYFILCTVAFIIGGAKWYIIDRAFFSKVYRKFYNWTHRVPMPLKEDKGFIHGQTTKTRFWWAFVLDTGISAWIVIAGTQNIFIEMIMWFWQIWMLMIGFILGKQVWKLWAKKEKYFDAVDKIESGEIDVGKQIADKSREALNSGQEFVRGLIPQKKPEPAPVVEAEVIPPPPKQTEDEARAALKKFGRS